MSTIGTSEIVKMVRISFNLFGVDLGAYVKCSFKYSRIRDMFTFGPNLALVKNNRLFCIYSFIFLEYSKPHMCTHTIHITTTTTTTASIQWK